MNTTRYWYLRERGTRKDIKHRYGIAICTASNFRLTVILNQASWEHIDKTAQMTRKREISNKYGNAAS
jgi:hypothetical protein